MTSTENRYMRLNQSGVKVKNKKLQEIINNFTSGKINKLHRPNDEDNFVIEYEIHPSFKTYFLTLKNYQDGYVYKSLEEALQALN